MKISASVGRGTARLAVLCCDNAPIVAALDDSSHDSERRKQRDEQVDAILAAAGLPIVHVKAQHSYVPADVAARLRAGIEL